MTDLDSAKLLTKLIMVNGIGDAAAKTERIGQWYECVIGIGKDHVAYITLDDEAFKALYDLLR